MTIPRRQLLLGVASLLAAPAIVRASSLMSLSAPRPQHWRYAVWTVLDSGSADGYAARIQAQESVDGIHWRNLRKWPRQLQYDEVKWVRLPQRLDVLGVPYPTYG